MSRTFVVLVFFGTLVLAWQIAAVLVDKPLLFPSPADVARYLVHARADGSLAQASLVTMRRLAVGYLIGLLVGLPLGVLCARLRVCADTLGVIALGLQTLPSVCWVPLAILWFEQSEKAMLFVVVMGTMWSIQIATADGLRTIPPIYARAARTMGSRGFHLIAHVLVPASLPAVIQGMKQGWAFAWRSLMAAEIFVTIIDGNGLGFLLHYGREFHDMPQVVGVMLTIVVIGLGADRGFFGLAERWVRRRWGTEA